MIIEDTRGGCKRLFSSPFLLLYNPHTMFLLKVWQLLLPFDLYNVLQGSWNHVAVILLVVIISIFSFGLEELAVQLEEPFSIFSMQGFCNNIYDNAHDIIVWDPRMETKYVERETTVMVDVSEVVTGGEIILEGGVKMVQGA